MEILIVSKTRMGTYHRCIGGLELATMRSVRLLSANEWNQPENTPYQIGSIWDIDYVARPNSRPPHVEDVLVQQTRFLRMQEQFPDFLLTISGFGVDHQVTCSMACFG